MHAEIRKRVGEFLILLIYLVIDFFSLWDVSHFWALVAADIGIVALFLLDGGFSEYKIVVIGIVVTAICVVIFSLSHLSRPQNLGADGFNPRMNRHRQTRAAASHLKMQWWG